MSKSVQVKLSFICGICTLVSYHRESFLKEFFFSDNTRLRYASIGFLCSKQEMSLVFHFLQQDQPHSSGRIRPRRRHADCGGPKLNIGAPYLRSQNGLKRSLFGCVRDVMNVGFGNTSRGLRRTLRIVRTQNIDFVISSSILSALLTEGVFVVFADVRRFERNQFSFICNRTENLRYYFSRLTERFEFKAWNWLNVLNLKRLRIHHIYF